MARHRVCVEVTTTVSHFMDIEAPDPREAKLLALELIDVFEDTGHEPEGVNYREGGIGGDNEAVLVSIEGGGYLGEDPEPIGPAEYWPWKEARDAAGQ